MGLFVTTTGSDVTIPELGIIIVDPATDYDISGQFRAEEVANSDTLTSTIRAGTLEWRKVAAGAQQPALDYDKDFLHAEETNSGPGLQDDRIATFKDLPSGTGLPTKSGVVAFASFSGNPKTASVAFSSAFADSNYSISIISGQERTWTFDSQVAGGFDINTNANQAPTSDVYWLAIKHGETT